MQEESLKRKIIIKICISLVLLVTICIIVFVNTNSYSSISMNSSISTTNYKNYYMEYIDRFINFYKNGNIENAYNLLSDDCKIQIFNNNIEEFTSYMKKYDFTDQPYIEYMQLYKDRTENEVYIFKCIIDNKQVVIHVIAYKPYDCKLYLVVE